MQVLKIEHIFKNNEVYKNMFDNKTLKETYTHIYNSSFVQAFE